MKNKILLKSAGLIFLLIIVNINSVFGYSIDYNKEHNILIELVGDPTEPLLSSGWYYKPNNYAELISWYQSLESAYPDYIEVFKANELYNTGTVTGGYDLYYVRITNETLGLHKPEVLFVGGPHGNENVGYIGLYWFTDWLMRMAYTDGHCDEYSKYWLQWIIDNREIYLVVCHNPYSFDNGPQRYDGNGWDICRECDYDGPGWPTGGIWGSVNGKTLREFVNHHLIRVGSDFHDGIRMLLYPWTSNHDNVYGTSPITGKTHSHSPPDFYYLDAAALRLGDYIGDYGGDFDKDSVGPAASTILYEAPGAIIPWAYGADVEKNPVEDPFVQDETYGNYPGSGVLWITPEYSVTKNPPEYTFGNDTIHRFGAEVRRFVLHQTDLAQPYLMWQSGTIENETEVEPGTSVPFLWQVNGSLVVDHTYIQWGNDPDPINNFDYTTSDYDENAGDYYGGTGWDDTESGTTNGVTYNENIILNTSGDYYFVAKAQVDQIYATVLHPEIYGNTSYLRIIKERTDDSYYEMLEGSDGTEEVYGQSWWYSPILHVTVNIPPNAPTIDGPEFGKAGISYEYRFTTTDPDGDDVRYIIDWGDDNFDNTTFSPSGTDVTVSHTWTVEGIYTIKAKAEDTNGLIGPEATKIVTMPRNKQYLNTPFLQLLQSHPNMFPILQRLLQQLGLQ